MYRCCFLLGFLTWAAFGPGWASAGDNDFMREDEQLLKSANLGTEGPALIEFLHQRIPSQTDQEKVQRLIVQLGDGSPQVRAQATAGLMALGPVALPFLRQTAEGHDVALAHHVKTCLKQLEAEPPIPPTVEAAVRLLAYRKPAGTVEVLLAYLPTVTDETLVREIQATLTAVALRDGIPEKALVLALDDKLAIRRAAAAEALCTTGGYRLIPTVRRLLQDPDAKVRLRVALSLGDLYEQDAIPVVIASLAELPLPQAGEADLFLRELAGELAPSVPLGNDQAARQHCRDAWTDWWRKTDGAALLDSFRRGTPGEEDRVKITGLIARMGDDDFSAREKASADLASLGPVSTPLLRLAMNDPDVEVAHRAEKCLKQIEKGPGNVIPAQAARLVALRKPAGATEVLLAYLPVADGHPGPEEVQDALAALALHDGKLDPTLARALDDRLPVRRAAAAVAMCQAAGTPVPAEARRLLQDPEPLVRLQVALALGELKDREAVPVLIALLGELPANKLWQGEEFLRRLAGEQAPAVALGTDQVSQRACRQAWETWWHDQGARVDLARLDGNRRLLGYTMLVEIQSGRGSGRVLEIGPDKQIRWQIEGLALPFDAQVLPGNRVLIAEYQGNRVTERNFKGDILWEKAATFPINVQRLPNGNTFIACQQQLLEVERSGKEIVVSRQPGPGYMGAHKLRDGTIACILQGGTFAHLDATGKELKGFPVNQSSLGGFDVLPNGHLLVPQYGMGKVIEFDSEGKNVWETALQLPVSASRLPNGHTLMVSQNAQTAVEVDRAGNKVWDYKTDGRPWQVRRR